MGYIVSLSDFLKNKEFFVEQAKKGKVFVYPTDTIYGIGGIFPCTLEKIYFLKKRPLNKKVSIVLPESIGKICNFVDDSEISCEALEKILNGIWQEGRGWTLISKINSRIYLNDFAKKIYNDGTIGLRILNHPFQEFINILGQPFITTSANISGTRVIRNIDELPASIIENVDFIIDGGKLDNPPSILIDISHGKLKVIKREN